MPASYLCRGGVPGSPGRWVSGTRRFVLLDFSLCCCSTPFLWSCPKKRGGAPKKNAFGWWRPREVSGPTRLSHSRGSCHSAAKVSASRTYFITRPRGEGFGLAEVWPSKSFLPRFFTKKRAGSRGGAHGRAPQRAERPFANEAQEGVKGGTLAGGSPFAGGLSRPQPMRAAVGLAVDEGKGRRGRRPLRRVGNGPCAA